jgi:hypothetical protein
MLHVVEIQYGNDALTHILPTMRKWLANGEDQPVTYRYSLFGTATVLHVDFELETEANAFAQAFGGIVLPTRSPGRSSS